MSDAAKSVVDRLTPGMVEREPQTIAQWIDQAADEKYRSLVDAVELCLSTGLAHGQVFDWLREALRKVKEG